ncbi:MAG: hypothetical protein JST21_04055 [Bacteroidetes bacterium]|nr:hypothetical protein [Bacteroidota bacterium]
MAGILPIIAKGFQFCVIFLRSFTVMREFFTDRFFILSKVKLALKVIVIISLLLFFGPLLILPFFNHATADDYFYGLHLSENGFIQYQYYIYHNWTGRFSTTFLSSIFLKNNFLFDHYYLHSLVFLAGNFIASFLFFYSLNQFFLEKAFKFFQVVLLALVFVALVIVCAPDTSGLIFWFSSAVVYYAGLIFFQIELLLFVLSYYSANAIIKTVCYILLPLLVFINNGFSEVMLVMQLIIFSWLYVAGFFKKTGKWLLYTIALFFVASFMLSITAPGNFLRADSIPALNIANIIAAGLYSGLQAISSIFKNPLVWLVLIFLYLRGNYAKHFLPASFQHKAIYYLRFLSLALFAFLLLSICAGVIGLKGRIVPDRLINVVCWFCLLMLCMVAFISGVATRTNLSWFKHYSKELSVACYAGLIVCLCCNDYFNTAYKSVLSAPLYNDILKEREAIFKNASKNKTTASVESYEVALKKIISLKHPNSSTTYMKWAQQKPIFLLNDNGENDEAAIKTLQMFYKVDSVNIHR